MKKQIKLTDPRCIFQPKFNVLVATCCLIIHGLSSKIKNHALVSPICPLPFLLITNLKYAVPVFLRSLCLFLRTGPDMRLLVKLASGDKAPGAFGAQQLSVYLIIDDACTEAKP